MARRFRAEAVLPQPGQQLAGKGDRAGVVPLARLPLDQLVKGLEVAVEQLEEQAQRQAFAVFPGVPGEMGQAGPFQGADPLLDGDDDRLQQLILGRAGQSGQLPIQLLPFVAEGVAEGRRADQLKEAPILFREFLRLRHAQNVHPVRTQCQALFRGVAARFPLASW